MYTFKKESSIKWLNECISLRNTEKQSLEIVVSKFLSLLDVRKQKSDPHTSSNKYAKKVANQTVQS